MQITPEQYDDFTEFVVQQVHGFHSLFAFFNNIPELRVQVYDACEQHETHEFQSYSFYWVVTQKGYYSYCLSIYHAIDRSTCFVTMDILAAKLRKPNHLQINVHHMS
uniref:Transposase n=1 Tax=Panagrellus redivivus TaxID=6233 RepID=A0A7E4ZZ89_PANRE